MKRVILGLLLIVLSACSNNTSSENPIFPLEIKSATEEIVKVLRSNVLIENTLVSVTLTYLKDVYGRQEFTDDTLVILDYNGSTFSYAFKINVNDKFDLITKIDENLISRIRNTKSRNADEDLTPIDLKLSSTYSLFKKIMALDLDRCRNTSPWKHYYEIATSKRNTLYLTPTIPTVDWVLSWDLHGKYFKGLVKTSTEQNNHGATLENKYLVITPMANSWDENGKILSDSVFVDFGMYSLSCDYAYDPHAPIPTGDIYLPRYTPKFEEYKYFLYDGESPDKYIGAAQNIYWLQLYKLTDADLEYAEQVPFYKLIKVGDR